MNLLKRIASLVIVLCIVLGVCACDNNNNSSSDAGKDSSTPSGGGYTSSTPEDYQSTVSDWKEEISSNQSGTTGTGSGNKVTNTGGSFDNNTSGTNPTPTPGEDGTEGSGQETVTKPVRTMKRSVLSDYEEDELLYFKDGSNYYYGITPSGFEYLAYKDEDGMLYDVLNGGGKLMLNNGDVLTVGKYQSHTVTMIGAYEVVRVYYKLLGNAADNAMYYNQYTFKENGISYACEVNVSYDSMITSGVITRGLLNGSVTNYEASVHEKWVYPATGDYLRPDFESYVVRHKIDDTLWLYSAIRGDYAPTNSADVSFEGGQLPVIFNQAEGLFMTYTYDIAFVDTALDGANRNYLGVFKTMGSEFATGVASITDGKNSTIFVGDKVDLNLNVTNLSEGDLTFSLRYDIRDYYGNIVDAGIYLNEKVYQYADANRKISLNNLKQGMYYLNLYVMSKYSTYQDCYSFAMLEKYDYKYNTTNPWGMASMTKGGDENLPYTSAYIAAVCGVANARIGSVSTEVKEMINYGITSFNGHFNPVNDDITAVSGYVGKALEKTAGIINIIDSMEIGNEMSLEASKVGGRSLEQLYPLFYTCTYQPTLKALKEAYPTLRYIPCPFSACEQSWINMFANGYIDTDEDGIADVQGDGTPFSNSENASWKDVEIVATHIYGHPWMPDSYGQRNPRWGGDMWNIECGAQRMMNCFDKNRALRGGKEDPDFYFTEVGYPTPAASSISVDTRTQADYIVRTGVILASYGVDRVQYYQMYDRTSGRHGFVNTDVEQNFGLCYEQDYFGIVVPKPAMIAFAAMTRQLESVAKNGAKTATKYDEGSLVGGVRAFEFDTALHGKVIVAYSNKQVLSNGKKNAVGSTEDRTPSLNWVSLWTEVDETVFDAVGDTVTVYDIMGHPTVYRAEGGKVTIPLTGEPCYIHGVK